MVVPGKPSVELYEKFRYSPPSPPAYSATGIYDNVGFQDETNVEHKGSAASETTDVHLAHADKRTVTQKRPVEEFQTDERIKTTRKLPTWLYCSPVRILVAVVVFVVVGTALGIGLGLGIGKYRLYLVEIKI